MDAICSTLPLDQQDVDALQWDASARALHERGARLLSLWGEDTRAQRGGFTVYACWLDAAGAALSLARHELPPGAVHYPGLHDDFPVADRLQRAMRDLLGLQAQGMDARPWLRHARWGEQEHPLCGDSAVAPPQGPPQPQSYPFVPVDGEGVHEVAVGPVHAGVIEPGQFRFSVVGEKILRLEARLGFTHKGVARRFEQLAPADGVRLAARLSGDSAVANAWAYCLALESLAGAAPPPRALHLRALLLERERLANHLGDIGGIVNDAGFGFGLAQFSRLKEDLLRLNAHAFGARYPFDAVQPGGVGCDPDAQALVLLHRQTETLSEELTRLREILEAHEGLQDRLQSTGRVAPDLARRLGMLGLAGRASGQALDLRANPGFAPYGELAVRVAVETGGDVAARLTLRLREAAESLRLCRDLLAGMPGGAVRAELPGRIAPGLALGLTEGWRGPALIALRIDAQGRIGRCHAHDPSWQNWPAVEWAVISDIVADFPLINKSFNLSYSGHDG